MFARKAPVPPDPALADARNTLREFVRNVLISLIHVKGGWDALHKEIRVDEANFAERVFDYDLIFREVVKGLGIDL